MSSLTQCENSALPRYPSPMRVVQNGLGQALCQPGERSKVIVICDTTLRGAALKSAVIVECRPSNEASAFTLDYILYVIVCHSGSLQSFHRPLNLNQSAHNHLQKNTSLLAAMTQNVLDSQITLNSNCIKIRAVGRLVTTEPCSHVKNKLTYPTEPVWIET